MTFRSDEEKLDEMAKSLPEKYRYQYRRDLAGGPNGRWWHRYAVIFPKGAVEVQYFKTLGETNFSSEYLGGVECHWESAPDYMDKDKPSQENCHLLEQPCWHDGSSMAFDQFKDCINDEIHIYSYLIKRGEEEFGDEGF